MMGCREIIACNQISKLPVDTLSFAENEQVRIPSWEGYWVICEDVSRGRGRMRNGTMIEIGDVG
jgi:hypothetical protein